MSTRSTTHFVDSEATYLNGKPVAIIYRHSDGYPECAGRDIVAFLKECKGLPDPRLTDPSYLAAKYVVFLANMLNHSYKAIAGKFQRVQNASRLDFLSVGVMNEDPGDIEYRYVVDCGIIQNGLPEVTCFKVREINGKIEPSQKVNIPR